MTRYGPHTTKSLKPTKKVTAAGVGGAAAIVIIFILTTAGAHPSPELASALTVLCAFGAGYLKAS